MTVCPICLENFPRQRLVSLHEGADHRICYRCLQYQGPVFRCPLCRHPNIQKDDLIQKARHTPAYIPPKRFARLTQKEVSETLSRLHPGTHFLHSSDKAITSNQIEGAEEVLKRSGVQLIDKRYPGMEVTSSGYDMENTFVEMEDGTTMNALQFVVHELYYQVPGWKNKLNPQKPEQTYHIFRAYLSIIRAYQGTETDWISIYEEIKEEFPNNFTGNLRIALKFGQNLDPLTGFLWFKEKVKTYEWKDRELFEIILGDQTDYVWSRVQEYYGNYIKYDPEINQFYIQG